MSSLAIERTSIIEAAMEAYAENNDDGEGMSLVGNMIANFWAPPSFLVFQMTDIIYGSHLWIKRIHWEF